MLTRKNNRLKNINKNKEDDLQEGKLFLLKLFINNIEYNFTY